MPLAYAIKLICGYFALTITQYKDRWSVIGSEKWFRGSLMKETKDINAAQRAGPFS